MEKFKYLEKIKEIYEKGDNIIQYLNNGSPNDIEDILISYDVQAGTYLKRLSINRDYYNRYCSALAEEIQSLNINFDSIMEVGVGEATTLSTLLSNFDSIPSKVLGFDISWSRLKFAKAYLEEQQYQNVNLFTGNLFEIPLADNAVEVVYSSHSIEPNGGKEKEALEELYRVTNKYLILLEPSYKFASPVGKERIMDHGFITNLHSTAKNLGYKVIAFKKFSESVNKDNPTELIIIEKNVAESSNPELCCPITKMPLEQHSPSFLYSDESFLAYPVLEQIPCLLKQNAILATHLKTVYDSIKS